MHSTHSSNPTPTQPQVLTVSELTYAIKQQLEKHFPKVYLQGEISNFKKQSSGHLYFSLKDAHAQVSAAMFRGNALSLTTLPRDGDQVIVRGEINVYPPRGQYQIIVRELHYVGLGELLLKFERLKQTLAKRGWFDPAHKRALPRFPKRIGIITSPTGAAIKDILNILDRRHSGVNLLLNPVRVQGAEAPQEIAEAIRQFNTHHLADVLVVGRGGGSIEDLWAFNEEVVARAIFESEIPIIAAVGHETDHSIADYVADVRAPTPSAAAEVVISEKAQQLAFLEQTRSRLHQTVYRLIQQGRAQLRRFQTHPAIASPYTLLGKAMQQCDEVRQSLDRDIQRTLDRRRLQLTSAKRHLASLLPTNRLSANKFRVAQLQHSFGQVIQAQLERRRERLRALQSHLEAIDPRNLLSKGYSILLSEKKKRVVNSVQSLTPGDQLTALLADGAAQLNVTEVTYDQA